MRSFNPLDFYSIPYAGNIRLTNIQVPGSESEPETEQEFTRRQRKVYEQQYGCAKAKRLVKKRKASALGKKVTTRSKAAR